MKNIKATKWVKIKYDYAQPHTRTTHTHPPTHRHTYSHTCIAKRLCIIYIVCCMFISIVSKANACAPLKWKKRNAYYSDGSGGWGGGDSLLLGVVKYDVATPYSATNMHTHTHTHTLAETLPLPMPLPGHARRQRTHALDTWRYRCFRCVLLPPQSFLTPLPFPTSLSNWSKVLPAWSSRGCPRQ